MLLERSGARWQRCDMAIVINQRSAVGGDVIRIGFGDFSSHNGVILYKVRLDPAISPILAATELYLFREFVAARNLKS
jgi:hypothetical protein